MTLIALHESLATSRRRQMVLECPSAVHQESNCLNLSHDFVSQLCSNFYQHEHFMQSADHRNNIGQFDPICIIAFPVVLPFPIITLERLDSIDHWEQRTM